MPGSDAGPARRGLKRHPTLASAAGFAAAAVAIAWGAAGYLGWGWPAGFGGATIIAGLALVAVGAAVAGIEMPERTGLHSWTGAASDPRMEPGTADGFGFKRVSNALFLAAPLVLAVGFALLGLAAVA